MSRLNHRLVPLGIWLLALGMGCIDVPPFPSHLFSDVSPSPDVLPACEKDGDPCESPDGCIQGTCEQGQCVGLMQLQVQEVWEATVHTDGEVKAVRLVQGADGSVGGAAWITDAITVCHVAGGDAHLSPASQVGDRLHLFGHRPGGSLAGTGRMETAVLGHLPWIAMDADGGLVLSDVYSAPGYEVNYED